MKTKKDLQVEVKELTKQVNLLKSIPQGDGINNVRVSGCSIINEKFKPEDLEVLKIVAEALNNITKIYLQEQEGYHVGIHIGNGG